MTDIDAVLTISIRLGLALIAGMVLGLNRWLHHKSAGIRTHSLVALGAAVGMLIIDTNTAHDIQANSRVLQGLVTGIGFLGAGVIIREGNTRKIHGLTTAASIWACALLGAAFGSGQFIIGTCALVAIMFILLSGGWMERSLGNILGINRESEVPNDHDETHP